MAVWEQKRLYLFRVGGVLVRTKTGGLQRLAFTEAFNEVFGDDVAVADLPSDRGKTVLAFLDEMLLQRDVSVNGRGPADMMESLDQHFARLTSANGSAPSEEMFPGAEALLQSLQQHGAVIGALSSGTPFITHRQLSLAGLASYFSPVGGYGSQHESRTDLVSLALAHAREELQADFDARNTFVVGATTHDIYSARACGVEAFAVANNPAYPAHELSLAGARKVVASLQELAECQELYQ